VWFLKHLSPTAGSGHQKEEVSPAQTPVLCQLHGPPARHPAPAPAGLSSEPVHQIQQQQAIFGRSLLCRGGGMLQLAEVQMSSGAGPVFGKERQSRSREATTAVSH